MIVVTGDSGGAAMRSRVEALTGTAAGKLAATVVIALLGWLCTRLVDVGGLTTSHGYLYLATALLAVGLYSSTQGIDLRAARANVRTVALAVTVGVGAKAALIAAVMYLCFRRPEYLVLAVAVAQIDPLSVATMRVRSRMSERARTVLLAWASFDDPVTTLLTIYLSGVTLAMLHGGPAAAPGMAADPGTATAAGTAPAAPGPAAETGLLSFGAGLLESAAFAAAALLIWFTLKRLGSRDEDRAPAAVRGRRRRRDGFALVTLAGLAAVAVWQFIMLGLALTGLFFRPAPGKWVDRLTAAAFLLAVFALGLLLGPGIDVATGAVLGVAAFAAQAVVALFIARRYARDDRIALALGQQNGITAIILALLLEPGFPGTVGIVAPAILVVNVLNIVANAIWDHWDGVLGVLADMRRRSRVALAPEPVRIARPVPIPTTLPRHPHVSPAVTAPAAFRVRSPR
jgi:hypothetical protein